mgnify:CR=1 FL=1
MMKISKINKNAWLLYFLPISIALFMAFLISLVLHHTIFYIGPLPYNDMAGIINVFKVEVLIRPVVAGGFGLIASGLVSKIFSSEKSCAGLGLVLLLTLLGNLILTVVQFYFGLYGF